eukprot:gnl/TRDRNA2_/TRDRNA2_54455_c0_seq1.p1 gnl/TRDRNA2_/TRDRNA2_54455_c0~~gnl/TRDRNA2_/TRDRNA2_54455_c0_seq1.p1  ORF type:complete len:326 (+),score=49.08 gnl/TRDRNA2_/TRDRNA2_54455_c0_seq1:52-1029(+)
MNSSEFLAANGSLSLRNASVNGTADWLTRDNVEHFLGDPDVLHVAALILGSVAILHGKRFPQLLAVVASVTLGLWMGLVLQDRQAFDKPLFGKIELPDGIWVPWLGGVLCAALSGVLVVLTWQTALALLTAGIFTLLALAICRVANVSPEQIAKVGASLLSTYRIVGASVLGLSLIGSAIFVRYAHEPMIHFASSHLGMLLLLSGTSHFAQRAGSEAPFSLLDDLARIYAEVRQGKCHIWEKQEDGGGLKQCDCGDRCRTEIIAWIVSSWAVLAAKMWRDRRERLRANQGKASEDETVPFASRAAEAPPANSPAPSMVGAGSARL